MLLMKIIWLNDILCMIWAKYVCGYLSYDNSMTKVVLNYMIMNIFGA